MNAPSPREIADTVFKLARFGLTEIAKNTENGPAIVAEAAARLEAWRAETDKRLSEPQPDNAPGGTA